VTRLAIGTDEPRAAELRQAPRPGERLHGHLEEAVAGDDIAQRAIGVFLAVGEDVRHAATVVDDLHVGTESGERRRAISRGPLRTGAAPRAVHRIEEGA
jgi:hypothetical protein